MQSEKKIALQNRQHGNGSSDNEKHNDLTATTCGGLNRKQKTQTKKGGNYRECVDMLHSLVGGGGGGSST